jgi:hypothetical protein
LSNQEEPQAISSRILPDRTSSNDTLDQLDQAITHLR